MKKATVAAALGLSDEETAHPIWCITIHYVDGTSTTYVNVKRTIWSGDSYTIDYGYGEGQQATGVVRDHVNCYTQSFLHG